MVVHPSYFAFDLIQHVIGKPSFIEVLNNLEIDAAACTYIFKQTGYLKECIL